MSLAVWSLAVCNLAVRIWLAAAVLVGAAAAGDALAQNSLTRTTVAQNNVGSDCILDNCADKKPPGVAPQTTQDAPVPEDQDRVAPSVFHGGTAVAPGHFDFYVLALSWSPGFCATGGADKAWAQCAPGANLGFVVHGLWPQNTHGFPSDCGPAGRYPSRIALQAAHGLYPDDALARHEWLQHGTCSGKSPSDYFADVRRARDAIVIPPPFRDAHQQQRWAPIDLERAFMAANPRLRPGMMSVECSHGVLSEVRICLSKDLRNFVACPEVARHFCFGHPMRVPPIQ